MTLDELRALATNHSQRVGLSASDCAQWRLLCPPGRVLELLDENERLRALVKRIDETLHVPAAEYVPAIVDVFDLIDAAKQAEEAL